MKHLKRIGLSVLIIGFLAVAAHIIYLFTCVPEEIYPADTYLKNAKNKSALIIVAHDDDAAPFSGTTSLLAANGWDISFMCFYTDLWKPEENPVRKREMTKAAAIQGFKNLELIDFTLRRSLDTVGKPWMPIPYDQFAENYKIDSLKMFILEAIQKYHPGVIFTMDNVIGIYGHPEHVLIGRVVMDICNLYKDSLDDPIDMIYQSVLPNSLAERIMGNMKVYTEGKRIYGCDGIPTPDVQMDISSFAATKKDVFLAHASQHRNLKKFIPYYHYYPGWFYFGIFDKEYFRVIKCYP